VTHFFLIGSRLSRVIMAASTVVLIAITPAVAVPEGWSDPAPVGGLSAIGLFVLAPALVIGAITLAFSLPRLIRTARSVPGLTDSGERGLDSLGRAVKPGQAVDLDQRSRL
jgi:hypothetical protein